MLLIVRSPQFIMVEPEQIKHRASSIWYFLNYDETIYS